jgi:hypothetical protein
LGKRQARAAAAGVAAEVPTEITQQLLERAQAGLPIDSDDAIKEYIEAGVAAGILGGPIGAVGGVAQRDVAPQELDQDLKELAAEGAARFQFAEQTDGKLKRHERSRLLLLESTPMRRLVLMRQMFRWRCLPLKTWTLHQRPRLQRMSLQT